MSGLPLFRFRFSPRREIGFRRKRLVLTTLLALAACSARAQHEPEHPAPPAPAATQVRAAIRVVGRPIPLDPAHPQADRIGDFRYAGGLHLTSPDTSLLGGQSDLKILAGDELVSESDEGTLLRAHIVLDARGRLAALDRATLVPLKGPGGAPLDGKRESDAEGVAVWPNGDLMVSFERDHRIWLYPHQGGDPRPLAIPSIHMPENQGIEGLALAPSQGPDAYWVGVEGGSIWLCRLTRPCARWTAFIGPGFLWRLSALGETPQGDLAILHDSWTPITGGHVRLSIVTIPKTPNGASRMRDRLELGPKLNIDNFEGVAAVPAAGGAVRFYLISDDNFSPDQRTLLEAFDWTPPQGAPR